MEKFVVPITIEIVTGLHIGIGGDKAQIGGIDNPFIKDPITKVPYIPGSSLKGKLRCLLETEGHEHYPGKTCDPLINRYFGATSVFLKSKEKSQKTTDERQNIDEKEFNVEENGQIYEELSKFIFRDFMMDEKQKENYRSGNYPLEIKTEISIDRHKGTVTKAGPRTTERVPPGTIFKGDIIIRYCRYKEVNGDGNYSDLVDMLKMLKTGFDLLQNDALGGSGSRGYGTVKINHELEALINKTNNQENSDASLEV